MKIKNLFVGLLIICFILPVSVAVASQDATDKNTQPHKGVTANLLAKGTNSVGIVTPNVIVPGNAGTAELECWAIGNKMMDADWTLDSSKGPITFVNAYVLFDNGVRRTFTRSCFSEVQRDSAQTRFSTTGFHTAEFAATGTIDFMFDFYTPVLVDGDTVY